MNAQSLTLATLLLALTAAASPAAAQSRTPSNQAAVEITPYVSSLGSYPSSRVGAAFAFRLAPRFSIESEVGYRRDVSGRLSASASLVYDLPGYRRFRPYLVGGIGLEEYATASFRQSDGALLVQPRTAVAINAGAGLKVPIDDTWGIRTDARWFNGLGRDAGEHWRLYHGITVHPGVR
jgi:hypothetical protein